MEKTIDLRLLFAALMRKAALILACTILGGALLFAYSAFFVEDEYTTSVSILVHNAKTVSENASTINDINAATKLTDQFIEILENPSILRHVANYVGVDPETHELRVDEDDLAEIVTFSSNGNSILKIVVTCSDATLCLDICEAMATRGSELLGQKVEASSVQRIESTKSDIAEPEPVSKGLIRNTLLGAIIGFVLSAGPIALFFYFDDTIKSGDDITAYLGLPVLGEVPSLGDNNSKSSNKEAKNNG